MAKSPSSSLLDSISKSTSKPHKRGNSTTTSSLHAARPLGTDGVSNDMTAQLDDIQAQAFRQQQIEQMQQELALRQQHLTSNDFPILAGSPATMTPSAATAPNSPNATEAEVGIYAIFGIEEASDHEVAEPTLSDATPTTAPTVEKIPTPCNSNSDNQESAEPGLFELFFGVEEEATLPTLGDSEPQLQKLAQEANQDSSQASQQTLNSQQAPNSQQAETSEERELEQAIPPEPEAEEQFNFDAEFFPSRATNSSAVHAVPATTADLIQATISPDSADYNADFAALLAEDRFPQSSVASAQPPTAKVDNTPDTTNFGELLEELAQRKAQATSEQQPQAHNATPDSADFAQINALTAHLSREQIEQLQLNNNQEIEATVAQLQAHQSFQDQLITSQENNLDPDFVYSQESIDAATPMMAQYLKIKAENRDKILFFRMGDFYEFFFDDAILTARELSIAVSSRQSHLGKTVPMSGIPFHAFESYAAKLVSKGYSIAICEQTSDPKAKGLTERGIVRIITPGTLSQDNYLPARESRPLVAIYTNLVQYAVALLDVSSGYLEVSVLDNFDAFSNRVQQYNPAEILFCQAELQHVELADRFNFHEVKQELFTYRYAIEQIRAIFGRDQARELSEQRHVVGAVGALIAYVQQTQMITPTHIQPLKFAHEENLVVMDNATINNLELFRSNSGNRQTCFVEVLDKCNTSMGARLFRRWVRHPTRDQAQLEARLDQVTILLNQEAARKQLQSYLKVIGDIERIVARISLDNCSPRDLGELRNYLLVVPHINRCIVDKQLELELLHTLEPIRNLLLAALEDKQPLLLRDGNVIRSSFNQQLEQLRDIHNNILEHLENLEMQEINATGIETLTVKKTNMGEIFINIPRGNSANLARIPGHYQHRQTLKNAVRYTTPAIRDLEQNYATAELQIASLEKEIFLQILQALRSELPYLQNLAMQIARLDVFCSFAQLAHENNYVRPTYNNTHQLEITAGRHPVIELILDQPFIANSSSSNSERSLAIITGPNMGGKSTYMRQNALISIMALIGSYVPASSANIPLFDKILTRIGASDDLASGKSTFMVEMAEMAHILESATCNSLLLIDEIGRGTSTYDGLSLAWATAQYLAQKVGAITFFSTHYFEMTELEQQLPNVYNLCATAIEHEHNISFLHEIIEGTANRSYGIAVAKLAGIPGEVLYIANQILDNLHTNASLTATQTNHGHSPELAPVNSPLSVVDTSDFNSVPARNPQEEAVLETLRKVNPNEITPIRALELLDNLQQLLQGKEK